MIRTILFITVALIVVTADAQTTIEQVLVEIAKNNKTLQSEKQYYEAQKLSFQTGLNPENPTVAYDYLVGSPANAGNQTDMSINQALDFPTSYGKRKNVSREQIRQADYQYQVSRQEILLQAKLLCLDLVQRNKLQEELTLRLTTADRLVNAFSRKTAQGESNVLDLNKIKLLRLDIRNARRLNSTEILNIRQKLRELNGDVELNLANLSYPLTQALPPLQELDSMIEASDPILKVYRQERNISAEQVALVKSISFPKFEAGYHYQAILGQIYQGFHVGATIPLWENKNKVKAQQARLTHSELQIEEHRLQHFSANQQQYDQYSYWRNTVDEYNELLSSSSNEAFLQKALDAGQISVIEYLMELRYFYDAKEKLLQAENELIKSISILLKFQL